MPLLLRNPTQSSSLAMCRFYFQFHIPVGEQENYADEFIQTKKNNKYTIEVENITTPKYKAMSNKEQNKNRLIFNKFTLHINISFLLLCV